MLSIEDLLYSHKAFTKEHGPRKRVQLNLDHPWIWSTLFIYQHYKFVGVKNRLYLLRRDEKQYLFKKVVQLLDIHLMRFYCINFD